MLARLLQLRRILRLSGRKFSFSSNPNPDHNLQPSAYTKPLNTTINKLFKERDLDKLVADFQLASESYRFRCRHNIYEFTVRRFAAAGRLDAVESILEHQKRFAADLTHEGFGARLISLYGKAGMAANAVATFNQLPSLGSPRTVLSFNAVLTALAASGDYPCVVSTFHDVPAGDTSIIPNLISYNILIKALCEKGDLDAVLDSLVLMEKNGIFPDLISFNILLKGLYENKRFSDADNIWNKMAKENIQPDIKCFNAKIRGLVSVGKTSEAVEILDEINQSGLKMDIFTFNAFIKSYCQVGNLEQAKLIYMDLIKNDCAPNKETFTVLIPSLCEAGELDLALRLSKESLSRRCSPGSEILQGLVDGLAKNSKLGEAKKLVEISRANGYSGKSIRLPFSCLAV
ncbi:pentatricopeptide repeat-containing protein At1g55890, mitochondrial-like [Phalaenopsis equestris]|uniref:pentatricopeptide repeat-containing protein At1g55890, mitochondrial-like n=1 Tax=Phalaenopsis equestris TaxID=78828 RepID=UPI0009E64E31|nr:pentatricopeptide repeat-containing protein At1g55890, mitochondrial-like [Phalaenopsis equestris]